MIFCNECGAANEDGSTICYECGAMLTYEAPVKKRTGIPKPVLIGGVALLMVALVVGVVLLVLSGSKATLNSALDKTLSAFCDGNAAHTQTREFVDLLNDFLKDGDYTMTVEVDGITQMSLVNNYSRGDKKMQGTFAGQVDLNGSAMSLDLAYSVDKKVIQFSVPGRFDNVYGIQIDKVDSLLNNPIFSTLLSGNSSALNLDMDFFSGSDLDTYFEDMAGDELEALKKSLEVEELDEKELNGQVCQVYKVTWSSDAASELVVAIGGLGKLPQIGELISSLIPELEPECRCYVNKDGYLVGLDFATAGAQCLFALEGKDNPWDTFSLTVNSIYGETLYYAGAMERTGSGVSFYLEDASGTLLRLDYSTLSGNFSFYTKDAGQLLSGQLQSADDRLSMTLEWEIEGTGLQQLRFGMAELDAKPQQLSKNYIDLLDMSLTDLTRFLLDLGIQIG